MQRALTLMACCALACGLAGCAGAPAPDGFTVEPGGYARSFQAAKDALRSMEFELERVDARAGVITTAPRASSGLATPWVPHASTVGEAFEGVAQRERRWARVRFEPADRSGPPAEDLRLHEGEMEARVEVFVERIYRPGRRVDATGVRLTSYAVDPVLADEGKLPSYAVALRSDERLAGRLARLIAGGAGR